MLTWFHSLRVSQKLMFISFFFLIPDSVLLTLFLFSINTNIHFAQWEQYGNEYQRPLELLLDYLPEHMLLSRTPDRVQANAEALGDLERRIDDAFEQLRAADARRGAALQFTDEGLAKRTREHYRVQTIGAEWRRLQNAILTLSPREREKQHLHLVADVRTMITHAGDTSNLILDPDLDSYYLMDVTLLALPQMQERLAAVIAYDDSRARNEDLLTEERSRFSVFAALLKEADLDRIVASTRTALNEDQNFYGRSDSLQRNLPPALDRFTKAADAFIELTAHAAFTTHSEQDARAFRQAGERVRRASFELWKIADRELDVLLQTRIEYYEQRRLRSLTLTGMAVMAAIGLVTFITRSISGPLKRQAAELLASNRTLHAEMEERQRVAAELARLNKELIEASRAAGQAEVATGVLHNVGNVLNSVNLGVTRVRERLEATRLTHLRKIAELFAQHQHDLPAFLSSTPQGQAVPGFFGRLTQHLEEENQQTRADLDALAEHVDHIKQVVSMQQSYARVFGVVEMLHPEHVVEDAIRLNSDSCARHRVTVERHFESTRTIAADRHKVLQILVNLLRNAKQAITEADPVDRRITIRVANTGADRIRISVTDTGAGISAENVAKVFRHGFTTKRDGHGFGLHSSALAAREMKGQLSVHSDGPARGATFTLDLPTTLDLPATLTA